MLIRLLNSVIEPLKNRQNNNLQKAVLSYDVVEDEWLVAQPYQHYDRNKEASIIIEIGFPFDLSSVPRIFWKLIGPYELSLEAPLIHDFLYMTRGGRRQTFAKPGTLCKPSPEEPVLGRIEPPDRRYSRRQADDLFLHMMEQAGVRAWRRTLSYRAVRLFGALFWRPSEEGGRDH